MTNIKLTTQGTFSFSGLKRLARERIVSIALVSGLRPLEETLGGARVATVQSTHAAPSREILTLIRVRPAHVIEAHYVHPGRLFLRFADGVEGTWQFQEL